MQHQFWKPDPDDKFPKVYRESTAIITNSDIKKMEKAARKRAKDEKRKSRMHNRENNHAAIARSFCINFLKLNKYATNVAIAYCLTKEYDMPMPPKNKISNFLIEFWKYATNEQKNGNMSFTRSCVKPTSYISAEDFYSSKKWIELRFIALSNSEGCCNLCGGSAKDGIQLHVDHIQPRSIRPDLAYDLDNLQVLCVDCNIGKSNYDSIDWR